MARKSTWATWGLILGAIAGILWIISGISMALGGILGGIDAFSDTVTWLDNIGGGLTNVIYGIIIAVIGLVVLLLSIGRFGMKYVFIGIILIVFAIVAGGLPALLALIGGIFYIVAGA